MLVEPDEEIADRPGLHEMLPEQPDRLGIRDLVAKAKPQKPHKGKPAVDHKLGLVIRQIIERLQHQDFEQ